METGTSETGLWRQEAEKSQIGSQIAGLIKVSAEANIYVCKKQTIFFPPSFVIILPGSFKT